MLEKDGRPVGNLFSARHGKRTYMLVMSGLYFDDVGAWKALMEEPLKRFSAYSPGS